MNWVRHILIFFIRVYQRLLSPLKMAVFGPAGACRFSPSCSQYTVEALQIHGVLKGGTLAAWRLCRCHPWGGCGDDRVPAKEFKVLRAVAAREAKTSRAAGATAGGN